MQLFGMSENCVYVKAGGYHTAHAIKPVSHEEFMRCTILDMLNA